MRSKWRLSRVGLVGQVRQAGQVGDERGIALILSLFLLMTLSILGVSLMFVAQTQTYASMSYRLMTQARHGAESGAQKAVNYLLNSYTPPGGASDPISVYTTTTSPAFTARVRSRRTWMVSSFTGSTP